MIRLAPENEELVKAVFVYKVIGPVMQHNYLCAVCRHRSAVLECNNGILQPCWICQSLGYKLVKRSWFVKLFGMGK